MLTTIRVDIITTTTIIIVLTTTVATLITSRQSHLLPRHHHHNHYHLAHDININSSTFNCCHHPSQGFPPLPHRQHRCCRHLSPTSTTSPSLLLHTSASKRKVKEICTKTHPRVKIEEDKDAFPFLITTKNYYLSCDCLPDELIFIGK